MGTYPHRSAPARATVDSLLAQLRRILKDRNHHNWHRRYYARASIRAGCGIIRIARRHSI